MKPRDRIRFPSITRAAWPVALVLLLTVQAMGAEPRGVICASNLSDHDRQEISNKLKKITGWTDLDFDNAGVLRMGGSVPIGGSATARALMKLALSTANTILIEDASRDIDVVFARVILAGAKHPTPDRQTFIIQIDFADFAHVTGHRLALEAFDVGWVMLHEIDHIVNDSSDADSSSQVGHCEEHINMMRRECGLPSRGDYFFTFLPAATDSVFSARFVRLSFEKTFGETNKKYWLIWDARLVGGLGEKQIASVR